MNNLTDELRKLAEAWPKESEWGIQDAHRGLLFFNKTAPDLGSMLRLDRDDRQNAAARTIIEDLLVDMGWTGFEWGHNEKGQWWLVISKSSARSAGGDGYFNTRTEALVKVANAILAVRSIEVSHG